MLYINQTSYPTNDAHNYHMTLQAMHCDNISRHRPARLPNNSRLTQAGSNMKYFPAVKHRWRLQEGVATLRARTCVNYSSGLKLTAPSLQTQQAR